MAVLTLKEKKYIEGKIRGYHAMKDRVAEWRSDLLSSSSGGRGTGKRPRRAGDPTAAKAARLAMPPPGIREKMLWVESIDAARGKWKEPQKEKLLSLFYWSARHSARAIAGKLYISERRGFDYRDDIVVSIAYEAAKRGLSQEKGGGRA